MNQEVKAVKVLSPSTPWTERGVPGIAVPDEQQVLKATFTEPTVECPECHALVTRTAMSFNAYVCPQCDEHLRMKARDRLTWFFDQVNQEMGQQFSAKNPLNFVDSKPYPERMAEAQKKTGETEALVVMQGLVKDLPMIACAFEFDFMGGSMGTVVGDRFVQAAERAIELRQPLICFAASGGARMQEGLLSLMQMAKTNMILTRLAEEKLPYISVLTDPTMGGVSASFAFMGDVVLAEPKALIGFAGPRVIENTVREKLPEGFQRSEFLMKKGAIDRIVDRRELREELFHLLAMLQGMPAESAS